MKKVYLETFGCQMNVSDSERVSTVLAQDGFQMTPDQDSADVVIINTCSVREKAEHKLYSHVGRLRKKAGMKLPVVGVIGCVAQLEGEILFNKIQGVDFVLGTRAVGRISMAVNETLNGRTRYLDVGEREDDYDWTVADTHRHSPYVAFLPIIEGCNKFCTYCIVPFSRGRERSRSGSEIVRQVLDLRRKGVKEVHLIGQNVNSYKPDSNAGLEHFKGKAFTKLLRAVAATGMERIKFTTSFPRDFRDEIVDAIDENENLCNWVHLPVQSGSDRVLKMMKRGHTIDTYFAKIDRLKSSPRHIALTTDIIVGFPGETEADFLDTVKMVEQCEFDMAYIFKYSPRPETPAFGMLDNVSPAEKTLRFLELERIQKRIQANSLQRYLNKVLKVLVEGPSTRTEAGLTGHSTCHKVVNFAGPKDLLGSIVDVKITQIKANSLFGEVC